MKAEKTTAKSKELIKEQKKWYKLLKEEGFNDIEYFDAKMEPMDILYRDTVKLAPKAALVMEDTEQFFILARRFLHTNEFATEKERDIWELFSEGIAYRAIADQTKIPYVRVFKLITANKKKMLKSIKTVHAEEIENECE